ncbi:MAG: nucleotidyl transferase AbiEii/AbiGii toxin family protein [Gammaproteobacteria bacterium]|nr:nucleotidyl transferase AbiEii/AbiGii toxin family protein [Gammaproteobacteria bacterium]MYG68039.1 nucleotidyl transferase AbiEii/AbiGii toxin family protein [Gammaproteobacteria bacterium]
MNRADAEDWKEEVLLEIFESLLTHAPLQSVLVFKGAHVLNERLQEPGRRSLDIDSNLLQGFVQSTPDRTTQQEILERELQLAISRYFQSQSPVKYSLQTIHVKPRPPRLHPRGWDSYDVRISIIDHTRPRVLGLPSITLDIAAPEALGQGSIAPLRMNEATVWAYTLERITGEKLRAFLSSLPAYRTKVTKPGEAVRVKDVFDIARIRRVRSLDDHEFWIAAGKEFQVACKSRLIDCLGLQSFEEDLDTTRSSYENDPTLPKSIDFDEAWNAIRDIVVFLESIHVIPFEFPIGQSS